MAASQTVKVVFDGKDNTSKAINSLKGNLGKADAAVSKIKSSLGGMTGAIGLAAGAAGFGALAKSALDSADKLGKASERMQVAASDLSSLQLAASYAGVETDAFTKLMEIFQKRIGEAAQGTGEAAGVLRQFGINAQEFAKLPLDTQLQIIADNMNTLENATEKAAVASDLFSNRGIKLINFFNLGSEGIKALREEFRDLGLEISDNQIDNIEAFNDSMTKLKTIINQAMIVGLAEAAPEMEAFAEKAAAMAVPLVGNLMSGLQFIIDNAQTIGTGLKYIAGFFVAAKVVAFANGVILLTTALKGMTVAAAATSAAIAPVVAALTAAGGLGYAIGTVINDFTGASDALADWAADLTGLNDEIEAAKNGTIDLSDSAGDFSKSALKAEGDTEDLKDELEELQEVVVTATKKDIPGITKKVTTLAKEEQEAAKETLELKEALEKLRDKAIKPQRDLEQFTKKMEILQKQFEETEGSTEDLERQMAELVKEFTGVSDEVQDVRDEIQRTKTVLDILTKSGGASADQIRQLEERLKDLGGELVEAVGASGDFTSEQRELLDEVTESERAIEDLNDKLKDLEVLFNKGAISQGKFRTESANIRSEIQGLKTELSPLGSLIDSTFDSTPVGEMLRSIQELSGSSAFDGLISRLSSTQTAIGGCFGTTPVTNFGSAIKDLFTGQGSALGGFGDALTGLTSALGGFFTGAEGKFSSFKTAIIKTLNEIAAAAIASVGITFLKNLIPGIATGGLIGGPDGYALGGRVSGPGGPKEDKVLARLSAGEYVINAASVSKFGSGFFDMLNGGEMPLPGFFEGGPVIPSFDPVSLVLNALIMGIFDKILSGIFGGESDSQQKTRISMATRDFTQESFLLSNRNLQENIGVGGRFHRRTKRGEYDAMEDFIIPRVVRSILPDSKGLDHFSKVAEGLPGVGSNFAKALYEFIAGKFLSFQFDLTDFNLDEDVKTLFGRANQIAGGSLNINPRQFGGPLERGQAALVGEDGPELFIPDSRGRVSPIATDGGRDLIEAVREVKDEVAALRRQMDRQNPVQLLGGRSA